MRAEHILLILIWSCTGIKDEVCASKTVLSPQRFILLYLPKGISWCWSIFCKYSIVATRYSCCDISIMVVFFKVCPLDFRFSFCLYFFYVGNCVKRWGFCVNKTGFSLLVVFLLKVPRRFLCCSSSWFVYLLFFMFLCLCIDWVGSHYANRLFMYIVFLYSIGTQGEVG